MEAEFQSLVKSLNVKSLVSGDKEARLLLQFIPTDELIDKLNRLMRADELVWVVVRK